MEMRVGYKRGGGRRTRSVTGEGGKGKAGRVARLTGYVGVDPTA